MAAKQKAITAVAGLAASGAATLAYSYGFERNAFTLRERTVAVLSPGRPSLRLLHVSDLHLTPDRRKLIGWVQDLARLAPDLTVGTGDFVAGVDAGPSVIEALTPLLGLPGMFVPGNADYFAPVPKSPSRYITRRPKHGVPLDWARTARALSAHGWLDLTHVKTTVEVAGVAVEARGVDDPYLRKDRYLRVAGEADATAGLRLGVLHAPEPRLLDAMTTDGVDLLLAGHTHGGQVRIPGYGALVTNCDIDRKRCRGLHTHTAAGRTAALHVSAGLGTSPYVPIRFCCRPEATLLTLTARKPAPGKPASGKPATGKLATGRWGRR